MSSTNQARHPLKCVCEMCDCGRHQCPQSHDAREGSNLSYQNNVRHAGFPTETFSRDKRLSPSPHQQQPINKNQSQYMHRQSRRASSVFERNANSIMQQGQFEGESSYNNSYKHFDGNFKDLRESVIKRQGIDFGRQFHGESNYLASYTGSTGVPTRIIDQPSHIDFGQERFNPQSTYNKNFVGGTTEVPQPVLKKDNIDVVNGRFDANSTYALNYGGVRGMPAQKARSRDTLKPEGLFNGGSTYTDNYTLLQGGRSLKVVMPKGVNIGEGKFDSVTTYNTNYDNKGTGAAVLDRPRSKKDLLRNDNKNYNEQSSYNSQYTNNGGVPEKIFVRESTIQLGNNEPFSSVSQYERSYDNKSQPKNIVRAPTNSGVLPEGEFKGDSTYTNHYLSQPSKRTQLIRHKDTPIAEGGFEGHSTYGQHYPGKAQNKGNCPVETLIPSWNHSSDQKHIRFNPALGVWVEGQ